MPIKRNKYNLYEILRRRNRSVADFVEEMGVRTSHGLETFIESLESRYTITQQFRNEAHVYIANKEAKERKERKASEEKVEDTPEQESAPSEEPPKVSEESPKQQSSKGKKRSRKRKTPKTETSGSQ